MLDRNAQVGWTDAQWNRVRQEVLRSWQSVRVAGSFLPTFGPLPPSTQVVPSELLKPDGRVDDTVTAPVLEISLEVVLTRQQVMDEDLSSALLQFRRRATQVGQLEDWYIFNGQYPRSGPRPSNPNDREYTVGTTDFKQAEWTDADEPYRPAVKYLESTEKSVSGIEKPIRGVDPLRQKILLLRRNPGALGLFEGAAEVDGEVLSQDDTKLSLGPLESQELTNEGLADAIVTATGKLGERGYGAPFVCVFGRGPFVAANKPLPSGAIPRDRLEPLIGREILHASVIDLLPAGVSAKDAPDWRNRGLLLSLAGDSVDIAIVAEATPEFRQVDKDGHYIFAVVERFALRIKDPDAVVPLTFREAGAMVADGGGGAGVADGGGGAGVADGGGGAGVADGGGGAGVADGGGGAGVADGGGGAGVADGGGGAGVADGGGGAGVADGGGGAGVADGGGGAEVADGGPDEGGG